MTDELTKQLENDIIFGVYPPGTRLIEERVIERYGAKRYAVRSAFAALEARRLLVHLPNRGVEVIQYSPDEVDALYEIRLILEKAAAERTILPAADAITDRMEEIAKAHEQACIVQEFRNVFSLNQQFHRVQFSCCGNPRLIDLIEEHARIVQPIRVIKYDDTEHMRIIVKQHFRIIAAMKGSSTKEYVQATCDHLPASAHAYRSLYERRFGKGGRAFSANPSALDSRQVDLG